MIRTEGFTSPSVHLLRNSVSAASCVGGTWEDTWHGIVTGQRRFKPPETLFPDVPKGSVVGYVEDWELGEPKFTERFLTLVRTCARKLRPYLANVLTRNPGARYRIYIASSHGDPSLITEFLITNGEIGVDLQRRLIYDNLLESLGELTGEGTSVTVLHGACASALVAVAQGCLAIRSGFIDVAVVIAADTLSRVAYVGFGNVGAMSKNGCRPFDCNRDGMSASEGSVGFILVNGELVTTAEPYTEILGCSYNCDGSSAVEPSCKGLLNVLAEAVRRSKLHPADIDCVYWHGTGTKRNDEVEAAVADRFWTGADRKPFGTSLKGSLGHTMGAASAFSIAAASYTLSTGWFPPTAGLSKCEFAHMNIVQDSAIRRKFTTALCVAMGFGGINGALVLRDHGSTRTPLK